MSEFIRQHASTLTAVKRWKFYYKQLPLTRKKKVYRRLMWGARREAALERALAAARRRITVLEAELAIQPIRFVRHWRAGRYEH